MISPLVSRSEFPVFNELTYLNTASMGLMPRRWGPRVDSFGLPEFRPAVSTDSGSAYRRIRGCTGAMSACLPVQALFDDFEHFHEMIVRLASQPVSSR